MDTARTRLVAALVVVTVCSGACIADRADEGAAGSQPAASDAPGPPPTTEDETPPEGSLDTVATTSQVATEEESIEPIAQQVVSPPRLIEIPTIGVEAEIIDLGLHDDGSLETPTDFAEAGWWAGGPTASEAGPTVIVGHVDSFVGPAVFFRLSELEAGDHIVVVDAHGESTRFRVTELGLYDKDNFPTERVYGDSEEATLRLVTCGGDFDEGARSYEANWVVFATPI